MSDVLTELARAVLADQRKQAVGSSWISWADMHRGPGESERSRKNGERLLWEAQRDHFARKLADSDLDVAIRRAMLPAHAIDEPEECVPLTDPEQPPAPPAGE